MDPFDGQSMRLLDKLKGLEAFMDMQSSMMDSLRKDVGCLLEETRRKGGDDGGTREASIDMQTASIDLSDDMLSGFRTGHDSPDLPRPATATLSPARRSAANHRNQSIPYGYPD